MYQNYSYPMYQGGASYQVQSLIRVTGLEGAKAYQMNANSTVALFDSSEDLMYIKTTDGAGFPTIRQFKFQEITQKESAVINADYVSRDEFEAFKKEMIAYGKQFIQQQSKQSDDASITAGKKSN